MKKDFLKYKDFTGSVHFGAEDDVLLGRIEGIPALFLLREAT